LVPCALLSYLLIRRVRSSDGGTGLAPFLELAKAGAPLLLGTVVPIGIFLAPYIWSHSTEALYTGTLIAPFRRVSVTIAESTEVLRTWPALVLMSLLLCAAYFRLRNSVKMLIAA